MVDRPAQPERLMIPGPAGALDALAVEPAGFDRRRAAVVCHPHPLHGGTMDNKVAHTLARALEELGLATVRFNFRGVGRSQGAFDDGEGETEDARAVCEWAARRWHVRELWLAGFSFGAFVATRLAAEGRTNSPIGQLITVAPPVRYFADPGWRAPRCPWLIVQGDQDELVDVNEVRTWLAGVESPPRLIVLAGVDHFFHGRLHELRDTLTDTLRSQLAGQGPGAAGAAPGGNPVSDSP